LSIRTIFHPDDFPSGRFSIRMADAQTGRPYSNHFLGLDVDAWTHADGGRPEGKSPAWFQSHEKIRRPRTNPLKNH
jgi:hypothetical protein